MTNSRGDRRLGPVLPIGGRPGCGKLWVVRQYRVTVGVGQDSADPSVLERRASTVQTAVDRVVDRGSAPAGATVVVDPVKATVQLVVVTAADDALGAAQQLLQIVGRVLADAGVEAPASILTVEAEAVPVPLDDDRALRPHPVTDAGPE